MKVLHITNLKDFLGGIFEKIIQEKQVFDFESFCLFFLKELREEGFAIEEEELKNSLGKACLFNLKYEHKEGRCRGREIICYNRINSYWRLYQLHREMPLPYFHATD
jgi:hypothetical protein